MITDRALPVGRRAWDLVAAGVILCAGCSGPTELTPEERAELETAVDSAVQAFLAVERAIDAEGVVGHMWPEFYMYQDGTRVEYDAVVAQTRETLPTLALFHADWTDIRVQALARNLVLSSFQFRDSIVTKAGALIQSRGPTTLLWERRGTEWRILYADADHYPVDG